MNTNNLFFAQHHLYTITFFKKYFGEAWIRVNVENCPHSHLLAGRENIFEEYLLNSWSNPKIKKHSEDITCHISNFQNLKHDIQNNGCKNPIKIVKSLDDKFLIYDGNHRAAISNFLDIPIAVENLSRKDYLRKIVYNNDERYGTKSKVPYQTIYDNNYSPILNGRRTEDLMERHNKVKQWLDLNGKRIIDFGANLGGALHLAILEGAKEVYHVEKSSTLLTAAIRLAIFKGLPNIEFLHMDLSLPQHDFPKKCDIAFCFSIHRHVDNDINLCNNILQSLKKKAFLVFECHTDREPVPATFLEHFNIEDSIIIEKRSLYLLRREE